MLTLSFLLLTLLVIGGTALAARWRAPELDARELSRRCRTLNTLATIVERRASEPATPLANPSLPSSNGVVVLGPAAGVTPGVPPIPETPPPVRAAQISSVPLSVDVTHDRRRPVLRADPIDVVRVASDDLPPDPLTLDEGGADSPLDPPPPAAKLGRSGLRSHHASVVGRLPQPQGMRRNFPASDRHDVRRRILAAAAIVVALASVAIALELRRPGTNAPVITEELLTGSEVAAASTDASTPPTDATPAPTTPLAPTAVNGDEVGFAVLPPFTLDLAADQPSWVRVTSVDGTVLAEQTLQPGGSTQVAAAGPVTVRTGNPAGLAVSANGRLLDHPRLPGQPLTLAVG